MEEYSLEFLHSSENAILVRDADDNDIWLPKSQIEIDDLENLERGEFVLISIPDWLAEEKDLA